MTPDVAPAVKWTRWVEWGFAALIATSVAYTLWFLIVRGVLPQPFLYGSSSFFTDWTATAFYANNVGAYWDGAFQSVYPPLSFVFLKIFTVHACYNQASTDIFAARDCDWLSYVTMGAFWAISVPLVVISYWRLDRRTYLARSFAVMFGLPMLYAIERGNLIVPCFTFFAMGQGSAFRSARMRWIGNAFAINFKPYLVMAVMGHMVQRRWRWLEGAALATVAVYLATFGIEGGGSPIDVATGIMSFATSDSRGLFEQSSYASSYVPILALFQSNFPIMYFLGSQPMDWSELILPLAMKLAALGVLATFALTLLKPHVVPLYRLAALGISLPMVLQNPGGYTLLYFGFVVFMERWRGPLSGAVLVIMYLLSLSVDTQLVPITTQFVTSYLTNRVVSYQVGANLGELLRPAALLVEVYLLVGISLLDLARSGWSARATPRPLVAQAA